ncbi:MAG: outer membrane protein assembly factor BamA [Gammaproteobacteria bacterium RIFCSPHIGHO2_02_FULL_39_13]|nr:MAG: outer membrane protein assembly factor BamA [Gammaproteobacteria bacterium RIFCSPHIGHO2_02_FULL_39_13]OGT50421.1 MAG: outer membrane protein assembly factor BamA [Gammaproteobacteria bacterium RIFCSPHIGHO2_12_FULL_39_24]
MRLRRVLFAVALSLSAPVFATPFVVHHIQVQGLQRVSSATVMHAIPLHVGETYNAEEGNRIIAALFHTGFFSDVRLKRVDDTLVVNVVERPTIDSVSITGNKSIKATQLKPVLKKLGIVVGYTFDPSELHSIVLGLQQQYQLMGRSAAVVIPEVKQLSRNRVAIHIVIKEGIASIVRGIHFSGNHAFSDRELRDQFKLTTPSIFTWFNHNDRYSSMRLDADLQNLQNFYFNHGYLDFHVVSHTVKQLAKGGIEIYLQVSEGQVYYISGYQLATEKLPSALSPKVHDILSELKTGAVFSRQQILDINEKLGNYLADNGYAFPQINPVPTVDHVNHKVYITYHISSGHRVYVRHVHIIGNTRTSGLVVRTQMRQMEGGLYSLKNVNESKRLIKNLGYLDHVEVTSKPVANKNNQVDLDYHVHEVNAGRASVNAGYSDVDGFLYGASVSEPNFMGSGKYVSVGFTRSEYTSNYGITYNNPFFTTSGISQGYNVYYSHTTPENVNLEPYTMDDYGLSTTYGIPISEYDQFTLGGGYDHIAISDVNNALVSPSVTQFLSSNPSPYNQLKVITGVSHATLDRAIFAKAGNEQDVGLTLGAPVYDSSLGYYQATYSGRWYAPLFYGFILNPHMTVGYGNGYGNTHQFPFFNNFYAGGLQTLPGYTANTLGPKNPANTQQAIGGNVQTLAGLNFILPDFINHKVRTALILDAGNIFQTNHVPGISYESISLNNLRVTTGIMVSWWSPLGAPLDFSLAVPLNKKPGDQLSIFGFSFGAAI